MDTTALFADLPPESLPAAMAVAIAAGTLYCFLGYRALKFIIGLTGFLLAAASAGALAALVSGGNLPATAVVALLGGLCGAAALFFVYKLGVFALGAVGGLVVGIHVLQGREESWIVLAIIGCAIGGGLLALLLERFMLTLTTAVVGAWLTATGLAFFIKGPDFVGTLSRTGELTNDQLMLYGAWILLALLGAFAQFATYRRPAKSAE